MEGTTTPPAEAKLLAIDPGCTESAAVVYEPATGKILSAAKVANPAMLEWLSSTYFDAAAIEMVASYGMAVGKEVFETVFWIGRFFEAITCARDREPERIFRLQVKTHLCKDSRAKDANIRAALIDRFGPGKDMAIGKKATPGPLYGISGDCWSALAVAVTFSDLYLANGPAARSATG